MLYLRKLLVEKPQVERERNFDLLGQVETDTIAGNWNSLLLRTYRRRRTCRIVILTGYAYRREQRVLYNSLGLN